MSNKRSSYCEKYSLIPLLKKLGILEAQCWKILVCWGKFHQLEENKAFFVQDTMEIMEIRHVSRDTNIFPALLSTINLNGVYVIPFYLDK